MPPEDSLELFPEPAEPGLDPKGRPGPPAPLADRMRPRSLDEVVGQDPLVGPGGPLRALAQAQELPSLILWGPPGCGKTTLARLLGAGPDKHFEPLSAVTVGVKEIRAVVERARRERAAGRRTVMLLDEIHRFNRAQQDALLPHVVFDGWSTSAIAAAAKEIDIDPAEARHAFPRGGVDAAIAFHRSGDAELLRTLAETDLSTMSVREKITFAVRKRLEIVAEDKEAVRRAASLLSLPQYAPEGAAVIWRTADAIWNGIGVKRCTLASNR